ncbi:sodium channel protein type 4 subunit alpha B-like isoform X2 [Toxotes jaculatrix]|uniref:sodium channel protein type 4 subunit alpha B-like isoform X2 n=1 Tax=Toxotes jaculatrix TaxID=941984 RepID=UPI001B3A7F92|nr:sodium channel protein type 4 subunit alpha B-like isoform X2 [Toxotes jaculatrix]
MMSRKISFFEFWRSQKERGALLKRADELRLQPAQLKCLLGDSAVRSELQNTRMASLLPPVGTEVFRRFIPASLEEIQQRHEAEEKERQRRNNKEVEDKGLPKRATHLEAGKPLPFIYGDPPPELLNTPLEELDPFYQSQKTFIVLSKGNIIHRFNAESTCYLLSPFSPMRTTATRILIHSLFRLFILLTLLTNCVFMIIGYPPAWSRTVEYVFTAIYTFEVVIKILSRGLCVGRFTFLRDPWNWLDIMVICTAFLTHSVYVGKLSVLSTIPRGLKMISVYPGVKRTAGALIQSVKRLTAVIVLMVFVLSILALIGLQLFMGNLRQKCVKWPESQSLGNLTDTGNQTGSSDFDFHKYISQPGNLYFLPGQLDALLCGNISDAGVCPDGYVCVRAGSNPNYGYTSYDSFGWSLLALFRLMTQDFWENLFQLMLQTAGKTFVIIFMLLVFPVCFCLISLFLVMVAMASVEQHMARVAEAKQKEDEFIQIQEVMKRREEKEEEEEEVGVWCQQAACRVELSEQQDSAPQKKNSAGVITCPPCCLAVLRWNCCGCWRWLKQRLYTLITNPFFDFGIVVCIVIDCIFFAMEHYPMTEEFAELLSIANLVFTGIYTAEMILKLLALDPYGYFQVRWNIYESIVVIVCWLELIFIDVEGLSILVGVEVVMRMLRLARWWPTLHMFMKVIWTSVRALRNLTLVLLIMVFLFTIAGTQLFHEDYGNVCRIPENCRLPRWHMYDFFHTFILIFRALCGEWIETMWDCMEVSGPTMCLIFYMTVLVIGNLLVLNLFLALLLNFFNNDNPKEKEENNVQIAVAQIKGRVTRTRIWILQHMWTLLGKRNYMKPDHKVADSTKECLGLTCVTSDQPASDVKAPGGKYDSTTFRRVPEAEAEIEFKTPENEEKEEKKQQDEDNANHRENTPEDCCCDSCYRCCPFLDADTSRGPGRVWSNFRRACFSVVQHKYFETFIIFIILLSSAALVFEDVHLQQRQVLQMVLDKADQVFAYLFLLEMVLKWIGCGFRKYFTSAWCWLDFLILAVSLVSIALGMLGYSELGAGLSLKTVRALRPLRALSRFQGLRVVLKVLGVTLPAMCDVLFVVLFVWCIFSITGVHLFAGKFYYCFNETSDDLFFSEDLNNKTECLSLIQQNYTEVRWKNTKNNYDTVSAGYLSLLQVATFKGWMDIMYSAVDSRQVESQPAFESNLYMYLYFICFIIIGRFFTFNFFIRVFINTLDQLRHKFGGKHVFMTEEQQKHLWAMKKLFSKKPQKPVPRPQNKCQALLFDLVTKQCFEVFMVVVICLNMVTLMVETQEDSMEKEFILHWFNFSFYLVFFIEFLLKITALRQHYFSDYLNILDFVIIFFSTVDLFIADLVEKYFFPQSLLPILRLGRISRIIHLFRWAQRIQTLLAAFMMSLPALFNICLLLFLLMFTFSSFGMFSFAHVKKEAMINDTFNFETFVNSMICLFTIITTAGWDGLLFPILNTPPDCDPDFETPGSAVRGNCGSPTVGIVFFTSYIILSMLLVVHLFIAVILETFSVEDIERLSDGDLQMFYKAWRKFDPDGSQVIQYSQLSDFCDALHGPLRIPKPNTIKLIHMDLPLLPGDKIHCVDVLLTLTAQVFGDSGETDALKATMEEKFTANNSCKVSYEPISSTLRRRQEEIAATVIQRAYRKHLLQDRDGEETVPESAGGASGAPGV